MKPLSLASRATAGTAPLVSDPDSVSPERSSRVARRFFLVPVRSPLRWTLALAAVVTSAAHVPVIGPHLVEAPYMGALFIVLTVACGALAVVTVAFDAAAVYSIAALTCGSAMLGYAATRLVAFPMLSGDLGNWLEPLGVVSIVAEAVVVGSALLALASSAGTPAHR